MLHILTLFLLPFFLYSAEASGVFMYLCFGEGCSGWDSALTCLSILFTMQISNKLEKLMFPGLYIYKSLYKGEK